MFYSFIISVALQVDFLECSIALSLVLHCRWISRNVLEPDHKCCIAGGFPGVPVPDEICGAAWDGRPAGPE